MSDFFASNLAPSAAGSNLGFDWAGIGQPKPHANGAAWSVPEAFLAILFSAAASDGDLAQVENEELIALTHRLPALKGLGPEAVNSIGTAVLARLAAGGETALAEACAALPRDMRPSAFAHALDLVSCDGDLLRDEADFLDACGGAWLEPKPRGTDRRNHLAEKPVLTRGANRE